MSERLNAVAKVFVRVERGGETLYLFSRKNDASSRKRDRLELLGGNVDGATPLEGAIRELREEEGSGLLASRLAAQHLMAAVSVEGQPHHIFMLPVSNDECARLTPDVRESLGFEWISESALRSGKTKRRFTRKTEAIFSVLADRL